MKKTTKFLIAALITALISAVAYYIMLPPINVYSQTFWVSVIFVVAVYGAVYLVLTMKSAVFEVLKNNKNQKTEKQIYKLILPSLCHQGL